MKRSEMEDRIMQKLRMQKHLFDTYAKKPKNMDFTTMITLLSERIMTEIEKAGMLPPSLKDSDGIGIGNTRYFEWEPEDETD